nr:hypothetical protein [Tanacetum cinerariifolium]
MVKLSVDLNEPKDSSKTDKAAQNGRTPKSLTLEIYYGKWFTPTHCRSYIGGHISSVNVVDIDEFCLHDLKDMVVKLGYGVEYLMYCHFLILSLGLDYGLHSLNVDADVLEMSKNVKKESEKVSSKSSSIGEIMKKLSKEQPASSVARPIVVESVVDPFDGLDEILGDCENTKKLITRDESTWKQMVVHVSTSSTADDFSFGKFKKVEVEAYTESEEEESDTEGTDTSGSDSEDLDYDPKQEDVFDDDEHIVEEVHLNMNHFSFTTDPKHDTRIGVVDVQEDDLNVIDYDSFGSDIDDEIDSERRIQLRELRRISKQKTRVPISGPAIRENINSRKQNILGKDKTVEGKGKKVITSKKVDKYLCPWTMLVTYTNECRWEVRTLTEDHTCIQSIAIKACTSRVKRIASDIMTGSYRERSLASQILTAVGVDANNRIYPVAYAIVEAERKRHIYENMKSQFKEGMYKEMLWNVAKATSEGEFKKKIGELKSLNSNAYDWLMKISSEQWSRAYFLGRAKCDLLINNICEVLYRQKWELTGIPCKHAVATIYNMSENSVGVVESKIVIIPPLYKTLIGRPPKKSKKSNDEIASQSALSGKLSRKGKSLGCGKCGNVGHNRKGWRVQGGSSSQVGARKAFGQAAGPRKVSSQAVGARNVSGQAAGARIVFGQAAGTRKASSQPNAAQSTTNQGPKLGFQGPITGPASGSQRQTKKLMDL